MNPLDRWRDLPPARRRLARQAAVAVPLATLALRLVGADRARSTMLRLPWRLRGSDTALDLGWSIEAVGRRVPGARCLARAVAADAILERSGRAPEMHVGARRSPDGRLEAHAWLEAEGSVVVGADERDLFTRLQRPGGPNA